eukprot:7387907-Prymnesium_polylepis.2
MQELYHHSSTFFVLPYGAADADDRVKLKVIGDLRRGAQPSAGEWARARAVVGSSACRPRREWAALSDEDDEEVVVDRGLLDIAGNSEARPLRPRELAARKVARTVARAAFAASRALVRSVEEWGAAERD